MRKTKPVILTGDTRIDGILQETQWKGPITYSFPKSASEYSSNPEAIFKPVTKAMQLAAQFALDGTGFSKGAKAFSVAGFTKLELNQLEIGGDLRYATTTNKNTPTAFASYPDETESAGDSWFGINYNYRNPVAGNYAWHTHLHETGHALGLKHPHDIVSPFTPLLDNEYNGMEYTVMSYNSRNGGSNYSYNNSTWDYAQTYMTFDVRALQLMYGANYSTNSGNTIYKWRPDSSTTLIDGEVAIAPGGEQILITIWDGGGNDTYDFAAYKDSLRLDLSPGASNYTNSRQLASSTSAKGIVYNALLYRGDTRSLIENAIGGSGDDNISGNQAGNSLRGNDGNDSIYGFEGNDILNGGAGVDILDGGNGSDTASYFDRPVTAGKGVIADLRTGTNNADDRYISIENLQGSNFSNDQLNGSESNNVLKGEGGNDRLNGFGGVDQIYGGDGNDNLIGGTGNDRLDGGNGRDSLAGQEGNDRLYGGNENDYLRGWTGNDALNGGAGNDRLIGDDGNDGLLGGAGNDRLEGGNGRDNINGQQGNDSLYGGNDDDFLRGWSENDYMNGGDGNDRLIGDNGNDRLIGGNGNDRLQAGNQRDVLTGDKGNDSLYGGNDNDTLRGGSDNDYLTGDAGNDRLLGDNGNDRLNGGSGNDLLTGGQGADVFIFAKGSGIDRVTDFDSKEDHLQFARNAGLNLSNYLSHANIVNGNHCEIEYAGGKVTLLNVDDLNELNGTLLFA